MQKKTAKNGQNKILLFLILTIILGTGIIITNTLSSQKQENRARAAGSGWLSGSSCMGTIDGSFAAWRGSPLTIAGTWNDVSYDAQENMRSISGEYGNWDQNLDTSIGAFWGSNWQAAANGEHDGHLRASLRSINNGWGKKKTIFIRYAHEFNGNWYQWKVTPADNEAFKTAWRRFYQMVQEELVSKGRDAKVAWSPNFSGHNGMDTRENWPGDAYVDVVSLDYYDWDQSRDEASWASNFMRTDNGAPRGPGAWQSFAKAHGKPMALSEWGPTGADTPSDNPFFIKKMNEFFRANAGTGPGQVWYDIYFDCKGYVGTTGEKFQIYPDTVLPNIANTYKSLKWGDGGINSTAPTVAPTTAPTYAESSPIPEPTIITPTLYCGGSGYCVPSTTPPQDTYIDQDRQQPGSNVDQPEGGDQPSRGNNDAPRQNQGFFQQFILFILQLIQALFNALRG